MRSHIRAVALPSELGEFAEEVRQALAELGRLGDPLTGECSPPIDVHETDVALEITMDLPGVSEQSVRILAKADTVLLIGEKPVRRGRGDSSFHLVERGYGRFARTVRLTVPCDTSRARATLADGELRITIPKISERRGRRIPIAIQTQTN
jgi:HSP20 family protein